MLQCYGVTLVAWLYWSRYVSSFLTRKTPETSKENTGASLKRLMGYMQPYAARFVAVLVLVNLSSYGE